MLNIKHVHSDETDIVRAKSRSGRYGFCFIVAILMVTVSGG